MAKIRTSRALMAAAAGLVIVAVGLAWLMAQGGGSQKATSGSVRSVLKNVGHVVHSTRGVGIERY